MPPLTEENVTCVFETANSIWLTELLDIPADKRNNPRSAAVWWIKNSKDKRWRSIIYYLDTFGEIEIANELMPYSEPPSGV